MAISSLLAATPVTMVRACVCALLATCILAFGPLASQLVPRLMILLLFAVLVAHVRRAAVPHAAHHTAVRRSFPCAGGTVFDSMRIGLSPSLLQTVRATAGQPGRGACAAAAHADHLPARQCHVPSAGHSAGKSCVCFPTRRTRFTFTFVSPARSVAQIGFGILVFGPGLCFAVNLVRTAVLNAQQRQRHNKSASHAPGVGASSPADASGPESPASTAALAVDSEGGPLPPEQGTELSVLPPAEQADPARV